MFCLLQGLILISLPLASILVEGKTSKTPGSGSQSLENFKLRLPAGSPIKIPTNLKLKYMAIGSGIQYYECGPSPTDNTMTWLYKGALAELRDVSSDPLNAAKIVNTFELGRRGRAKPTSLSKFPVFGKHSFVLYQDGATQPALSPKFEISGYGLTGEASYLIAKKVTTMPSPRHPDLNVPWLQLQTVKGQLAQAVLRTYTRGGQAPKGLCKGGEQIGPLYAAVYVFFG